MSSVQDVLVVGTGHSGAQAAIALRQRQFGGSITVVGEEPDLPYERPPLSKDYLSGHKSFEQLMIRPREFWSDRNITLQLGTRIIAIDADQHVATTGNGEALRYHHLVWAAGGRARTLGCEGRDLSGVHTIRNRTDIDRITAQLPEVNNVVVIGAGYIGLEAAAVLTKLGKRVTVLKALDRVLARVAGEDLSRFMEAEHRSHNVNLQLRSNVSSIEGRNGRVAAVRLADGTAVACDMVIVGIGIIPQIEPLTAAGAAGHDGVAVDAHCRTSLADIFAIGDCAQHHNAFAGNAAIRLESVQNANDMAAVVADVIGGEPRPYRALPWFWSNQYDVRLQTVGISRGYDEVILRGELAARSFSIIYRRAGRVIALDCINASRDYAQGRAIVTAGARIDAGRLRDPQLSLKQLAADAAGNEGC